MAIPYAAFPKYGPGIVGQAKYDAEVKAWQAYQASLRNPDAPWEQEAIPIDHENLDTFTYIRKYVKCGQTRERIFREQGIRATGKHDALEQGRDAMVAEMGPRWTEDGGGDDGGATIHWRYVLSTEKVVKPRGKPMQPGNDSRRNEEGANGTDSDGKDSQSDSDADAPDKEQESPSDSDAEGDGDGKDDDDTPKMPTCPECGEQRGSTPGCCATEQPSEVPKPDKPAVTSDNLQLLRTDGEAPYSGPNASDKIRRVSHSRTVETLTKSLGDVDTWTRGVVKHDVQALATELYGALAASHTSLKGRISKNGGAPIDRKVVEAIVATALKGKFVGTTTQEAREIARKVLDQNLLDSLDTIADLVLEKMDIPRQIEIVKDGKTKKITGTPHMTFDESLRAMTRGLDLFIVGPAGSGKGFLAQHLAEALDQRFGFISCSEGMSEGMLLGRGVPLANEFLYLQSSFVDFYENGGVFLLDEIDAANPNVLLIINECLSSPHLSIPNRVDNPYAVRHKDFYAIVAANTWGTGPNMEYVGRNRLDAAFLNRFVGSQIELGYDAKIEGSIAKAYMGPKEAKDVLRRFWGIRKKLEDLNIRRVWSTRGLEKMCIALSAGDDMATVLDAHTRGWTRDEKSKAGVEA